MASADRHRLCELLGLSDGASEPAVRSAYLQLRRNWHPDRFTLDPELRERAVAHMRDVQAAYETVMPPRSRLKPVRSSAAAEVPRLAARAVFSMLLGALIAVVLSRCQGMG
jgi:DnaJ-class molecular chaperone